MEDVDSDFLLNRTRNNTSNGTNGDRIANWNVVDESVLESFDKEIEDVMEEEEKNVQVKQHVEVLNKDYENLEEIDKAALIIQKLVLRSLALKTLHNLKKRQFKRMNGVKELWKTEVDYSNSLVVLREVYMKPLKKLCMCRKNPLISRKDYRQIFQGLEAICGFSEGFAQQLRTSIFDMNGEYNHFNFVSVPVHSMRPFLKMFNEYSFRYHRTLALLKNMKRENRKFSAVLNRMDRDERTTKLGLTNYIVKPIGRVPRYKLLLREIIKYTEEEHPDYEGLQKAMEGISEMSKVLNERMYEVDNSEKVLSIQKRFVLGKKISNYSIHVPHRRFVSEGPIWSSSMIVREEEEEVEKETNNNKERRIYLHLFNDILLVSEEMNQPRGGKTKYSLLELYHLDTITLFYDENMNNQFKIDKDIYQVKTINERNDWLRTLYRTTEEWKKKVKQELEEEKERRRKIPSPLPPIPAPDDFNLTNTECVMIAKNWKSPTVIYKHEKKKRIFSSAGHLRKFLISPTEDKILWHSGKRNLCEVNLLEVHEVVMGQSTISFHQNPKISSAAGLSLSLVYGEGEFNEENLWTGKSLDLICMKRREFKIWSRALRFIIQDRGKTAHERKIEAPSDFEKILKQSIPIDQRDKRDNRETQGDLYTFGGGRQGGLGHGNQIDSCDPKIVRRSLLVDFKKIVCDSGSCIAILSSGQCIGWGGNEGGKLGLGDFQETKTLPQCITFPDSSVSIIDACIGADFSLFLDDKGAIWGCGSNSSGVLGPEINDRINLPKIVFKSLTSDKFVSISCSPTSAATVDSKGQVFTWGNGEFGQLGHGNKSNYNEPKFVESLYDVSKVAFGNWHTLFLTKFGEVFSCGDGSFGQLGVSPSEKKKKRFESLVPLNIPSLNGIVQVDAGQFHCGAISNTGELFMWGGGNYGQIGNGSSDKINYEPIEVHEVFFKKNGKNELASLKGEKLEFIQLSCGSNHCVGLVQKKADEEEVEEEEEGEGDGFGDEKKEERIRKRHVIVWGSGMHGRLGLGTNDKNKDVNRLTCNSFFDKKKMVRSVSAGGQMSAVIVSHEWIPDDEVQECMNCLSAFSKFRRRRHHCRWCWGVFCGRCSKKKKNILMGFSYKPVRVCDVCFNTIKKTTV